MNKTYVEPTRKIGQKRAREIMGKNFFGIEEAIKHFGINPTNQQLTALSEIPLSEDVLEQTKDTHVLVAVFPLSILDIRGILNNGLFYEQCWYERSAFAKKSDQAIWRLVRKTPLDNSTSKNWQEQQTLLGKDEGVPSAQVMTYTIIGHYLAADECLFQYIYVRTSSIDSNNEHVYVGNFNINAFSKPCGLVMGERWDSYRSYDIGVSSVRK